MNKYLIMLLVGVSGVIASLLLNLSMTLIAPEMIGGETYKFGLIFIFYFTLLYMVIVAIQWEDRWEDKR